MIWVYVFLRAVANPLSNVFQKVLTRRQAPPLVVICATHGMLSAVCLPALWLVSPAVRGGFWPNMLLCAALAVAGNTLLVEAMRLSDLSVLGPVNAYKAVVSLIPGAVWLDEVPGLAGLAGIGLIVAGSYALVDREPGRPGTGGRGRSAVARFVADRGVQLRFAALVLSAVEAVFLKRALRAASPAATFVYWAVLGFGMSAAALVLTAAWARRKSGPRPAPDAETPGAAGGLWANAGPYLLLGLTTGVMQLCTLLAFQGLQVGYALALFQTSTLLTVVLGYTVFREPHFARRMAGSVVMVAGAAMIVWTRKSGQ